MGTKHYLWTEEEDARLIALSRQGKTRREIGEILGRPIHSVKGRVKRLEYTKDISHRADVGEAVIGSDSWKADAVAGSKRLRDAILDMLCRHPSLQKAA